MHNQRQARKIKRSNRSICWLLGIFLSGFAFLSIGRGQELSLLDSFDGNHGAGPVALIQGHDGNFYGVTTTSGTGAGCVFEMTPQGVTTILHKFGDGSVSHDGAMPSAGLIQASDGNFYGTTSSGGSAGKGTVFAITSLGAVTILHSFGDGSVVNDGAVPQSSLIQGSDGNLYGTTSQGGSAGEGAVFKITLPGVLTILHSFGDGTITGDGVSPTFGLTQDVQGNLYGTTSYGGSANQGAVYKINAQMQTSILYSFAQPTSFAFSSGSVDLPASGPGGYYPNSRLILGSDGNLYGTTTASGFGYGTVFKITPQGQESVLHYFGDGTVSSDGREGSEGENPLLQGSDGNFYGTTAAGGSAGKGALFEVTPSGQTTLLHSFGDGTVTNDGITPEAGIIQGSDGAIYGTTSSGGSAGLGTIFKVVSALPEIASSLSVYGAVGVDFSYQTVATQTPTSYSASGLPTGLSIDDITGQIFGTPVATGTSRVTLTVTNAAGSNSSTLVITIVPPPVITSLLSAFGSTASAFGYQITATGSPSSFGATGLPAGLTVDPVTGIISGTPSDTGTFTVTISAANLAGSVNSTLTLVITAAAPTLSQEYVVLHNFNDGSVSNEGQYASTLLASPGSGFYGVTAQGGASGLGTIFNLSATGNASVFADLGVSSASAPQGLVQGSDGNFYGTTEYGGSANQGTVFMITPAGVTTLLHTFGVGTVTKEDGTVTSDGANPQGGIIQGTDGNFYGTTQFGGSANLGTIFKMTPQGGVTIVHSFGDGSVANDGAQPVAALVQDADGLIYGTTLRGGVTVASSGGNIKGVGTQEVDSGTVFSLSPAGMVTILHFFADGTVSNDGQNPHASLVDVGGTLYGTTTFGGSAGKGTIFEITAAGSETILHHFGDGSVTNDGMNPLAPLLAFTPSGGALTLFGTTQNGGAGGEGTVFELDSTNTLTILHSFDDGSVTNDGQNPLAGLALDASGNLYGTTLGGGAGSGTMYAIAANLSAPPAPPPSWTLTGSLPPGMVFDSTTGTISGTPSASAPVGGYVVAITSPQNVTSSQAIDVTQTFAQWASVKSTSSTATATPMKDGIPNLLKYLTNINPSVTMSASDLAALPTLGMDTTSVPGTEYLTLTYRQSAVATGLQVVLQTSTDLQNWWTVDSGDLLSKQMSILSNGDSMMELGVKAVTSGKQFIRLNVTTP
jgi:uncharacterized repeat protein (TIGR03803 family)